MLEVIFENVAEGTTLILGPFAQVNLTDHTLRDENTRPLAELSADFGWWYTQDSDGGYNVRWDVARVRPHVP